MDYPYIRFLAYYRASQMEIEKNLDSTNNNQRMLRAVFIPKNCCEVLIVLNELKANLLVFCLA